MTHPGTVATPRITLPPNVVICPCGLHYMVRGKRIRRSLCRQLQERVNRERAA